MPVKNSDEIKWSISHKQKQTKQKGKEKEKERKEIPAIAIVAVTSIYRLLVWKTNLTQSDQ